jgi:hypothetical protein
LLTSIEKHTFRTTREETACLTRRSKKPKHRSAQDGSESPRPPDLPQPAEPAAAPTEASSRRSSRRLLAVAAIIAALWWCSLALMAAFTANPVTLNREQILRSDAVVTGTVDTGRGSVEVQKQWKGDALAKTLEIGRLKETGARDGRTYLVPLEKEPSGGYDVTRSRLPNNDPLIYPATTEAIAQLERLLSEQSANQ